LLETTLPHCDRRNTIRRRERLIGAWLDLRLSKLAEASAQTAEVEARLIGTIRLAEGWVDEGSSEQ
jgi:hypothetical protein